MVATVRSTDRSFRADIEGLRAVAVLAVTLFHFDFVFLEGGFLGVDIFFVISGYLITGKIAEEVADGSFRFAEFYRRRVRRILPASIVAIGLTLLAAIILYPPELLEEVGRSAVYSLLFAANFFFSGEVGYFDPAAIKQPLLHFWSLAVEEQFYFVWPAILVGFAAVFGAGRLPLMLVGLFAVAVAASEAWILSDAKGAYYQALPRFFEFICGALILPIEHRVRLWRQQTRDAVFLVGLTVLLATVFLYDERMRFPGVLALPVVISTAAVILAGGATRFGSLLANGPMRFVGCISYSLYLVHWPVVVYYKFIWGEQLGQLDQAILTTVAVGLASAMFHLVEQPFRKKDPYIRWAPVLASRPYALVALMAIGVLAPAVAVAAGAGLPWRISGHVDYGAYKAGLSIGSRCRRDGLPPEYDCAFGDVTGAKLHLLIVGDSHSTQLRTPFAAVLTKQGRMGMAANINGCVPLHGASVIHERNENWFQACSRRVSRALNFAIENPDVKVIVLAARWTLYTRTTRLGESASKGRVYLGTRPDDERSAERSETVFRYRLLATVKRLVDSGKKVIIIGQVPNLGFDLQRCLFSPVAGVLPGCEDRPAATVKEDMHFTDGVFRSITDRFPGDVLFVNPMPAFCDSTCHSVVQDRVRYIDSNHINRLGAALLFKHARNEIIPFLD